MSNLNNIVHHPERVLHLTQGQNVRDLGGYPGAGAAATQWRQFVRAGDMDRLSDSDCDALVAYGVTNVIDLRMRKEIDAAPNVFSNDTRVAFHHHDF